MANINPLILANGSVYWEAPEKFNISFRGDKAAFYESHPHAIPAHLWYSEDPYIDEHVRKARFERIVGSCLKGGINFGDFARQAIENVITARDTVKTGGSDGGGGKENRRQAG